MKNYLKCVGFTVLVTCFIATVFITVGYFGESFYANVIEETYHYSIDSGKRIDTLVEIGNEMESSFVNAQEQFDNQKEMFGEDYPALGIFLHRLLFIGTDEVVYINLFAILIGITYGTVFYIIAIQKAKGKRLILELIGTLAIILVLIQAFILIYSALINKYVGEAINDKFSVEYNINIIVPFIFLFIVTVVIVGIGTKIYQSVENKKTNKEEK